jgi:hypothetical protein
MSKVNAPASQEAMLPTIAQTAECIRAGWDPWRLLNEFLHAWYDYHRDDRAALIADPITQSEAGCASAERWVLLCVGVVEHLCVEMDMVLPAWVST